MDTQTVDLAYETDKTFANLSDRPSDISLDEWMNRLGRKLIAHYGEDFRMNLNKARTERGLSATDAAASVRS